MVLNETAFKRLLKNLPTIKVLLEREGLELEAEVEFQNREIISGDYLIFTDFTVYESFEYISGDYDTPDSYSSNEVTIYNTSFQVYREENDEEIHLTDNQIKQLREAIESSISTIY